MRGVGWGLNIMYLIAQLGKHKSCKKVRHPRRA